jgi:hypothetical protein
MLGLAKKLQPFHNRMISGSSKSMEALEKVEASHRIAECLSIHMFYYCMDKDFTHSFHTLFSIFVLSY